MAQTIITADAVQQAAASGQLVVPTDAIITPLARDVARDLGVNITRQQAAPAAATGVAGPDDALAARVRSIMASLLGTGGGGASAPTPAQPPRPRAVHASMRDTKLQPFSYPGPPPGMTVETVDVITGADGSPVAAGYMSITKGVFPWKLDFDELQIVLEGELRLGGDAGGKVGYPGDILFCPKGSKITFETPTWAKFVYITFPANWEDQIQ